MLVGNTKSCEACVKQDVCKFASTRQAVLSKLEGCVSEVNDFTNMPFVVSLYCNSFSNNIREKRGM